LLASSLGDRGDVALALPPLVKLPLDLGVLVSECDDEGDVTDPEEELGTTTSAPSSRSVSSLCSRATPTGVVEVDLEKFRG
jgi:hypothetical protein